jgi:hypothetical protein
VTVRADESAQVREPGKRRNAPAGESRKDIAPPAPQPHRAGIFLSCMAMMVMLVSVMLMMAVMRGPMMTVMGGAMVIVMRMILVRSVAVAVLMPRRGMGRLCAFGHQMGAALPPETLLQRAKGRDA